MLRRIARWSGLFILIVILHSPAFSRTLTTNNDDSSRNSDETVSTNSTDAAVVPAAGTSSKSTTVAPAPGDAVAANAAQQAPATDKDKKDPNNEDKHPPKFTPLLATTGTLGLFTLETADTLPKHGFAFSAFGNKFGRMPGSVTVFQVGIDATYAVTDNFNIYAAFDPYGHIHAGCPGQLSVRSIPLSTACAPVNFGAPVPGSFFPAVAGSAPGYVEDYPFAGNNVGGIGNITLGVKYALLNQHHGAPVGFSVRNDLIISTKTDTTKLLANGTQGSPLSDLVSIAVSRQWSNLITGTFNLGYMFVRAPRDNTGANLFDMANQLKTGAGIILFPESRFQPMMEYSAIIFDSAPNSPANTTLGARDPIDGVWGVRMYPWKNIGIDLGYRYMLNLRNSSDRSGFVVKLGTSYWPEKAAPVNHPPAMACSADKPMVYADSNDAVSVTCTANDPDNDPLTYTWSSTSGKVDGTGAQVRWLSNGVPVGTSTITAKVDDGRGGYASSNVSVNVETKPNHPPTITCFADRPTVFTGEKVHIACKASDPDGDPLSYTWRANGGNLVGNGPEADFDTSGLAPGTYAITTRVEDGRSGAADATTNVDVKAVPPPPQASKISDCAFGQPLSARIDNVCKRILDDVALRLQNEPKGGAVIIGYSDPKERKPEKVSADRAANAVKYLGEKGIDASRITTKTGSGQTGAKDNRRIDVIWVPEGATY